MSSMRIAGVRSVLLAAALASACGLVERLDSAPVDDVAAVDDAAAEERGTEADAPRAERSPAGADERSSTARPVSPSPGPPASPDGVERTGSADRAGETGPVETAGGRTPARQEAPLGILERYAERDPAWPDSVGRLLSRRYDDPDRETVEGYLLYLPPGIEQEEEDWPVILYLHGRSLRGSDLERVKRYGIPSFIRRGHQLPFIVVSPQLPAGQSWVDGERVWELLDEAVLDRYPVDRDRVYLTGFSMGAGGSWRVALANPDKFAAVLPIAATTPGRPETWIEALGDDVPVLYYHGDQDAAVPYQPAADFVRALQEGGVDLEFITLEGEDHNIVQQIYGDPEIYLWFLTHER